MSYLESRRVAGEVVTGLLYVHPDSSDMLDAMAVTDTPLNALDDAALIPGAAALAAFNDSLR
jgi:2-oxoglutarate/2-oxoacid ferredoxin oxidoreductase subunit beta